MKKPPNGIVLKIIITPLMIFLLLSFLPKVGISAQRKPAARLGDITAHGGSIVAGCATVLICGRPAARVGDMHVCPQANPGNPPVPHVGGPILMGTPTVLIGGMPAARVGDLAQCTGPPDIITAGCPTVLIGLGGAEKPRKYSFEYIKKNYNQSLVIREREFKKRTLRKRR